MKKGVQTLTCTLTILQKFYRTVQKACNLTKCAITQKLIEQACLARKTDCIAWNF